LNYLHSKAIEYRESEQDLDDILSRDWKIKLAASLVPRGMELNEEFIGALRENWHHHVFLKFTTEAAGDWRIGGDGLVMMLQARKSEMAGVCEGCDYDSYWNEFLSGLAVDDDRRHRDDAGRYDSGGLDARRHDAGRSAVAIASTNHAGARVGAPNGDGEATGFDISAAMLEVARSRAAARGAGNARFVVGDLGRRRAAGGPSALAGSFRSRPQVSWRLCWRVGRRRSILTYGP
jgi:hypothetical protein